MATLVATGIDEARPGPPANGDGLATSSIMSHDKLNPSIGPDDHYLGPADAAVILVEYGDYECPHCGRANAILKDVLARLGERVRYVFRHFPSTEMHPDAEAAAEAAESVAVRGGNDAFWDMHDILF